MVFLTRIELVEGEFALVESVDRVNELLERNVAVAGLACKVAFFVWSIFHVESIAH
jgi:hypothetical protein